MLVYLNLSLLDLLDMYMLVRVKKTSTASKLGFITLNWSDQELKWSRHTYIVRVHMVYLNLFGTESYHVIVWCTENNHTDLTKSIVYIYVIGVENRGLKDVAFMKSIK